MQVFKLGGEPNDGLVGRIAARPITTKREPHARRAGHRDRTRRAGRHRGGVRRRSREGHGRSTVPVRSVLKCEAAERRLSGLLRPGDGHRRARADRRRGRHHRRPVDRRAGNAADDADLPHRRCGRGRHHPRPAARGGAVRGAQAEGPREDRRAGRGGFDRGDRQGAHGRHHRPGRRGAPPRLPAAHTSVRRRRREDHGRPAAQRGLGVSARAAGDSRTHRDRAVPGEGGPGGLQVPGRGHQRQAHRADRAPDAEEGAGRPEGRHRLSPGPVRGSLRIRESQRRGDREGRRGRPVRGHHPRHHEGVPEHGLVPVGRLLPGDDQGADRRRPGGQDRSPERAQGERDHRQADPGGDRPEALPADRDRALRAAAPRDRRRRPARPGRDRRRARACPAARVSTAATGRSSTPTWPRSRRSARAARTPASSRSWPISRYPRSRWPTRTDAHARTPSRARARRARLVC